VSSLARLPVLSLTVSAGYPVQRAQRLEVHVHAAHSCYVLHLCKREQVCRLLLLTRRARRQAGVVGARLLLLLLLLLWSCVTGGVLMLMRCSMGALALPPADAGCDWRRCDHRRAQRARASAWGAAAAGVQLVVVVHSGGHDGVGLV
jgi:hypothetical protein